MSRNGHPPLAIATRITVQPNPVLRRPSRAYHAHDRVLVDCYSGIQEVGTVVGAVWDGSAWRYRVAVADCVREYPLARLTTVTPAPMTQDDVVPAKQGDV